MLGIGAPARGVPAARHRAGLIAPAAAKTETARQTGEYPVTTPPHLVSVLHAICSVVHGICRTAPPVRSETVGPEVSPRGALPCPHRGPR